MSRLAETGALAIFCVAIALLLPEISFAKNSTSSDITLADQGDINLFQKAFSGGGSYDTITGILRIEDGDGRHYRPDAAARLALLKWLLNRL